MSERIQTGYAALQTDSDDVPIQVSGIAIGENDITRGGSGKETLWPRETLEASAEGLEGQPLATDTDHTADNPKAQTPVEAIAGEVTWAGYKPGVGVLYEAEVDDEDLAKKIENGRLDVSPLVSRELEALESDEADYKATEITRWRDLALVSQGASESNQITVGSNPMKAEALHKAISETKDEDVSDAPSDDPTDEIPTAEALKEVAGVTFEGTDTGKLDESEIPNDDFEGHYLYPGENKSDSTYAVVDADGNLRKGNVNSAWQLGCRGQCPSDESHDSRLMSLAEEFESPPDWASGDESMGSGVANPTHWEACGVSLPLTSDDETNGSMSQSSAAAEGTKTMSETDLSDDEKAVLSAAESLDSPVEALESLAAAEQPTIVEQDEYESLSEQVETAKDLYAEALSDRWGTDADKIKSNFGLEALREEFEDEEGNLDKEALVQQPETGDVNTSEEEGVEALSEDADMDKAEALYNDYTTMNRPPKGLEDDIVEALGVDEFDDAIEVLD